MSSDSTARFSNRVDDYARYRPSYPAAVIDFLCDDLDVRPGATVADIGSGTGIFSRLLLHAGFRVVAVEPNAPMREVAERELGSHGAFTSVAATAEATTLPDASVDLVTAAQAFHWFDVDGARAEFARILRPGGIVALLWNDRRESDTDFGRDYQALIDTYNTDLAVVDHRRMTRDDVGIIELLFGERGFAERTFANWQDLDFDGLRGRLVSSSYIPSPGASGYDDMIRELRTIFDEHAENGVVRIEYHTRLYYGRLGDDA